MLACGFEPEDNGEVLALRDATGKKWTQIPTERLEQLKVALAEVEAQRRGLEHPEVADVQAVSAAVARLQDTRGGAAGWATAIGAVLKYVENILGDNHIYLDRAKAQRAEVLGEDNRKPKKDAKKHRFINMSNAVFTRQVASQPGAVELMVALGFREAEGGLLLPNDVSLPQLKARGVELKAGLEWLQRRSKTEKKGEADAKKAAKERDAELAKAAKGAKAKGHDAPKAAAAKPARKAKSGGGSGGSGSGSGGGGGSAKLQDEVKRRVQAERAANEAAREASKLKDKLASLESQTAMALSMKGKGWWGAVRCGGGGVRCAGCGGGWPARAVSRCASPNP